MAKRLIVNEDAGKLSFTLDHGLPEIVASDQPFASPFQGDELQELRWYLEDYLKAPYAVWEDRGSAIEAKLGEWGEALFDALFGPGKPGRDAYARLDGGGDVELWLASTDPAFLGLPFELMRDPKKPDPLAFALAGINRTLPGASEPLSVPESGTLRVLMVIARPAGEQDAGYRAVARPLFDTLEAVAGQVEVELCRPPTFAEMERRLGQAKGRETPYHILHFDGHGTFGAAAGTTDPLQFRGEEEGFLLFEGASEQDRLVPARAFGRVIDEAGVPLVVFNACRSGQLGQEVGPEATVATRLLQGGTAAVVAMSHSVYVRAAAEFMAAFYESLFQGEAVTRAVARGRRRLQSRPLRPSPKGDLPLRDWCVPVHYGRRTVRFPSLQPEVKPARQELSLDAALDRVEEREPGGSEARDELAPAGGRFFGRDLEFYRLEQALAAHPERKASIRHPVALIQGLGGSGKTELAKAYARWLQRTGWVERVVVHSFEPGLATFGLDGLLARVGSELFGTEFSLKTRDDAHRAEVILATLRAHRIVLVLDNFESVRSMPDPTGATPPLDDEAAGALRAFLREVSAGAQSLVLITSRSDEVWLDEGEHAVRPYRLALGGLLREEVSEYADHLLAGRAEAQRRRAADRTFETLLERLEGHPLSLRLILPRLEDQDVATLLAGLDGQRPLIARGDEDLPERHRTLDACVAYSLAQLLPVDRKRVVALALFESCADADVLAILSTVDEAPDRLRGVAREDWSALLDRASGLGVLTSLGMGVYRLHPALPGYLRSAWKLEAGAGFEAEWVAAEGAFIRACAVFGAWLLQQIQGGEAALAMTLVDLQRRSLGRALGEALRLERFADAQEIMQPLNEFWEARGLGVEAKAWVDRVRVATEGEGGDAPDFDTLAGALWLFAVGSEAIRLHRAVRLDAAESAHRAIASILERSSSESARRHLAVAYHQLGMVAQERNALDDAEAWYRKSFAIAENLGNRPGMASSYHQLGRVAQKRNALDDAEAWYRKALAIAAELGNRPYVAAITHQLGMVAQQRGALNKAEVWYKKSLEIKEALGNRPGMARGYHQLGIVAQERNALDDAEAWYRKSLAIDENLGNRPGMASSYGQLGLLEEVRSRPDEALAWTVRCVTLFDEFPHPSNGPGTHHLVRLTGVLGMPALEATWQRVTGKPLPAQVRGYVEAVAKQLPAAGEPPGEAAAPSLIEKITGWVGR